MNKLKASKEQATLQLSSKRNTVEYTKYYGSDFTHLTPVFFVVFFMFHSCKEIIFVQSLNVVYS